MDIAEKAIELGFDTAVGAMTGGSYRVPHAIRMFGSGAREDHKDRADAEQQMLYAAIKSGREILNNKLTAGLTKIFEQSEVSTIVRYTFNNLTDSATGSKSYKILLKGGEGAVEELVEGVLEPLDKAVYQNITMDLIGIGMGDRPLSAHEARELLAASKKPGYFSKTDIAKLLYNALLGFVIGTMEGGAYITADISR